MFEQAFIETENTGKSVAEIFDMYRDFLIRSHALNDCRVFTQEWEYEMNSFFQQGRMRKYEGMRKNVVGVLDCHYAPTLVFMEDMMIVIYAHYIWEAKYSSVCWKDGKLYLGEHPCPGRDINLYVLKKMIDEIIQQTRILRDLARSISE